MITGIPKWIRPETFTRVMRELKNSGIELEDITEEVIKKTLEEMMKPFNEALKIGCVVMYNKPIEEEVDGPTIVFGIGMVKEISGNKIALENDIEIDKNTIRRIYLSPGNGIDNPDYDSDANMKVPEGYSFDIDKTKAGEIF
jgi:hypothetical protein